MIGIYDGYLVCDARVVVELLGAHRYRGMVINRQVVSIPGRGGLVNLTRSEYSVTNQVIRHLSMTSNLEEGRLYHLRPTPETTK